MTGSKEREVFERPTDRLLPGRAGIVSGHGGVWDAPAELACQGTDRFALGV